MELIDIQSRTEQLPVRSQESEKTALAKLKWFRTELLKLLKKDVNSLVITNMSVADADGSNLYVLKLTKDELSILKGKGDSSKTFHMNLDTFDTTINKQQSHPGILFDMIKRINADISQKKTSTFEEMKPTQKGEQPS